MCLYSELKIVGHRASSHEIGNFRYYYGKSTTTKRKTKFHIKRQDEYPTRLRPFAEDFKKEFDDCIGIIDNTNSGKFGTYDYEEIVTYYNNCCSD